MQEIISRTEGGKFAVGHICLSQWKETYSRANRITLGKTKICPKCKKEKPISEFGKRYDKPVGITAECKKCLYKRHREYENRNKDKVRNWRKVVRLRQNFGLTPEKFEEMKRLQNNCCAICGESFKSSRSTHIDHDHKNKVVRGILCAWCNQGIGFFRENQNYLKGAIDYLGKHNAR
jgi:hypothetical protein